MPDEVGQLAPLLHQITVRKSCDPSLEAGNAEQLAQHQA